MDSDRVASLVVDEKDTVSSIDEVWPIVEDPVTDKVSVSDISVDEHI